MYFDVRVTSPLRNAVFVDPAMDCLTLSGHLVMGLAAPLRVNRISLNLRGMLNVHFKETFQDSEGRTLGALPFEAEECVINCDWRNLLVDPKGQINGGDVYDKMVLERAPQLSTPLMGGVASRAYGGRRPVLSFSASIPMGSTPFPNSCDSGNVVFELPPGNYCLPFTVQIPSYVPPTVESLGTASIVYRFRAVLDVTDGPNESTNKYIRLVRAVRAIEATQEHLVENSWPGKMEYKIRLPRRNVAIGSTLKIYVFIVPLLKNLRLDTIKLQIVQTVKLRTKESNELGERCFTKNSDVYYKAFPPLDHSLLPKDAWPLLLQVPLPCYVSQCSPDTAVFNESINVKHKMVLYINFVNPNGHISQIKSKLPIAFTISPDEYVVGKAIEFSHHGKAKFSKGYQLIFDNGVEEPSHRTNSITVPQSYNGNPDEFLFNDASLSDPSTPTLETAVPPPYTKYQYDSLFEPDTSVFVPSPRANTPVNPLSCSGSRPGSSAGSLPGSRAGSRPGSFTNLAAWSTPSYKQVHDDDTVGEPTPLYSPRPIPHRSRAFSGPPVVSSPLRNSSSHEHILASD